MVFPMVFGLSTIGPDGFLVATIGLNGFAMVFGLATIGLNGFSMVANHWSNGGMVTIHRTLLRNPPVKGVPPPIFRN